MGLECDAGIKVFKYCITIKCPSPEREREREREREVPGYKGPVLEPVNS